MSCRVGKIHLPNIGKITMDAVEQAMTLFAQPCIYTLQKLAVISTDGRNLLLVSFDQKQISPYEAGFEMTI